MPIVQWWDKQVEIQPATLFRLTLPFFTSLGVVSAPLWNSGQERFAGMLTVLDIIHLIQYYYHTATYDTAAADVETFRLESLRGLTSFALRVRSSSTLYRRH
jgi:5'-AMP-activated protein kinase, regulatory gamma subunit